MTSNLKNEKYEQSLKSNVYECNGQNYKIENSRSKIQEKESESDQNKTTQINNQKQNASPDIIVQ